MEGRGLISHVLDTCALLDLAAGRWTDRKARLELRSAEGPVALSVSVWEIARKLRVGKLKLPCDQAGVFDFVEAVCRRYEIAIIPLDAEVCCAAELLPPVHEDPFDRMVVALAVRSNCPVFTTDVRFPKYPVRVLAHR
jgi:PIN domain nuclease of toxin-antitoxin system